MPAAGIGRRAKYGDSVPVKVRHLREELATQLELVVKARIRLNQELSANGGDLTRDFTARMKDLTACFTDITQARIRLDTSEKKLGDDLTPAQERETAIKFILSLEPSEQADIIAYLTEQVKARK